jgi:hypothetical protein
MFVGKCLAIRIPHLTAGQIEISIVYRLMSDSEFSQSAPYTSHVLDHVVAELRTSGCAKATA